MSRSEVPSHGAARGAQVSGGPIMEVALGFLRWLRPAGPWMLVAIAQEKTGIRAQHFTELGRDIEEWLLRHQQHNIYYHVNPTLRPMTKKADRTDIAAVELLHVDSDPRAGENLQDEQTRIRKLMDNMPRGVPKPSAVVFSGGGYNALWRLREPIPLGGDLVKAEEAKRYNLQLEILLGGDSCHNVDRILRLPGTVNWPDEKKRRKGRLPCTADVVWLEDTTYPISDFVAAPLVQSRAEGGGLALGGSIHVQISGNVPRLRSVDELGEKVSQRTKMLIVQGMDPDEPGKWSSRSELLFHVCAELVRAGCTDEQIFSVITDPDFLISASVLDKGSATRRYAERQIQRAREDVINPHLRALNERHWVVGNIGGRCRVVEEVVDHAFERPRLTMQSFEDIRNRYMNVRVEIGRDEDGHVRTAPLGKWWLEHPNRHQYERIVFMPKREAPGCYNMWQGFAYEAKPGDKHRKFLDHVRTVVCGGVLEYYEYLVRWMARGIQQPDTPGEVAVVLRGDQGTGKSTVAREYGSLWGRHYLAVSDPKHLVGSFNAHLRDAVFVFADEAFYAGDKKHESILKTMITEELLTIEAKGRDVETTRNFIHLMMASNGSWVIPAGPNERRFLVLDVKRHHMGDTAYWEALNGDMRSGGRENLLHYLLTLDLAGFDVRRVPRTDALRDQKLLSFSSEQEWWYQKLEAGQLLRSHVGWTAPVFCESLVDDYLTYAQRLGGTKRATATALGRFLHAALPEGWPQRKQINRTYVDPHTQARMSERAYAWFMPPLEECRAWWDAHFGGPYAWPQDHHEGPETQEVF